MYGYVYIIKNIVNNKVYVGQTLSNPTTRWKNHLSMLNYNHHDNEHLQNSFNKYGINNFKFYILNWGNNQEELDKLEIYYIKKLDCLNRDKGYNMLPGGLNSKHSEETKEKIKKALTGKIKTDKHRKNLSLSKKGKPAWNKGVKHSKETCKKMSEGLTKKNPLGYRGSYYHQKNIKPWKKVWASSIRYDGHRTFLGLYNDPLSPSIIFNFVRDEIYK